MFRGVLKVIPEEELIEHKVRKDRMPRDTTSIGHKIADYYFSIKFGIPARSQSLFVTGNAYAASEYGQVCAVFPVGDYSFIWSPKIYDFAELPSFFHPRSTHSPDRIIPSLVMMGVSPTFIEKLIQDNLNFLTAPPIPSEISFSHKRFDELTIEVLEDFTRGVQIEQSPKCIYELIRHALISLESYKLFDIYRETLQHNRSEEQEKNWSTQATRTLMVGARIFLQTLSRAVEHIKNTLETYQKGGNIKEALSLGVEVMLITNEVLLLNVDEQHHY